MHPGREWFTVLSGEVRLQLGERVLAVQAGEAAEFSTLVPHLITPVDGPAELLSIFDHDGTRAHLPGAATVGPRIRRPTTSVSGTSRNTFRDRVAIHECYQAKGKFAHRITCPALGRADILSRR